MSVSTVSGANSVSNVRILRRRDRSCSVTHERVGRDPDGYSHLLRNAAGPGRRFARQIGILWRDGQQLKGKTRGGHRQRRHRSRGLSECAPMRGQHDQVFRTARDALRSAGPSGATLAFSSNWLTRSGSGSGAGDTGTSLAMLNDAANIFRPEMVVWASVVPVATRGVVLTRLTIPLAAAPKKRRAARSTSSTSSSECRSVFSIQLPVLNGSAIDPDARVKLIVAETQH